MFGTSEQLFLVEERERPGAGFWGGVWTESPHRKKRDFFKNGAQKKVREFAIRNAAKNFLGRL